MGALALIVGAIVGLAGVEALMRLVLSPELVFETWYSPGIHTPSDTYGFVFTPNHRGVMYHPEGSIYVPLELDPHGFRRPARTRPDGPATDVVLLGGFSMAFAYGLPDDQTPHARVAARSTTPLKVYDVAWPGFDAVRMYQLYEELLDREVDPKAIVLQIYNPDAPNIPAQDFEVHQPSPKPSELFRALPGMARNPPNDFAAWLGPSYYATYTVPQTTRRILELEATAAAVRERIAAPPRPPAPQPPGVDLPLAPAKTDPPIRAFVRHLEKKFAPHGTRIAVAFLPMRDRNPDCYAKWRADLDEGIEMVDLQQQLGSTLKPELFIADGHYGPELADRIGNKLSELCGRLLVK